MAEEQEITLPPPNVGERASYEANTSIIPGGGSWDTWFEVTGTREVIDEWGQSILALTVQTRDNSGWDGEDDEIVLSRGDATVVQESPDDRVLYWTSPTVPWSSLPYEAKPSWAPAVPLGLADMTVPADRWMDKDIGAGSFVYRVAPQDAGYTIEVWMNFTTRSWEDGKVETHEDQRHLVLDMDGESIFPTDVTFQARSTDRSSEWHTIGFERTNAVPGDEPIAYEREGAPDPPANPPEREPWTLRIPGEWDKLGFSPGVAADLALEDERMQAWLEAQDSDTLLTKARLETDHRTSFDRRSWNLTWRSLDGSFVNVVVQREEPGLPVVMDPEIVHYEEGFDPETDIPPAVVSMEKLTLTGLAEMVERVRDDMSICCVSLQLYPSPGVQPVIREGVTSSLYSWYVSGRGDCGATTASLYLHAFTGRLAILSQQGFHAAETGTCLPWYCNVDHCTPG